MITSCSMPISPLSSYLQSLTCCAFRLLFQSFIRCLLPFPSNGFSPLRQLSRSSLVFRWAFVPMLVFQKLLLGEPRLDRHVDSVFAVHSSNTDFSTAAASAWSRRACKVPKQSARRLTASYVRSTIHCVASSARSPIRANAVLGHSPIFHDATHAAIAQTIWAIKSMTQASMYTAGGCSRNHCWALVLFRPGFAPWTVAFRETRAVKRCELL